MIVDEASILGAVSGPQVAQGRRPVAIRIPLPEGGDEPGA